MSELHLARLLRASRVDLASTRRQVGGHITRPRGGGGTGNTGSWAITGVDHAALTITVNGGSITGWGTSATIADGAVITVGGTSAEKHYVFIEVDIPALTNAKWNTASQAAYPVHEDAKAKLAKWRVWIEGGLVKWEPHEPWDIRSWHNI